MNAQENPEPGGKHTQLGQIVLRVRKAVPFLACVLAAFGGLILYNLIFPAPLPMTPAEVEDAVGMVMASATSPPAVSSQVYRVIQPSLVLVQASGKAEAGESGQRLGSGVIVTDSAEVLTSLHVVAGAEEIEVIFADGTRSSAVIQDEMPEQDLVVLFPQQPPSVVVPAVLGNPAAMSIGDEAYVVGNPFGLYSSMSAGVISGFDRSFHGEQTDQEITGLIQIDSAVNPGNSGGPLLNRYGQVVGIVIGILNPTEDEFFIGIGFAVPITAASGGMGSPLY